MVGIGFLQTSTCMKRRLWACRIFPNKVCCRSLARPCPQAKVHQEGDGRAGEEDIIRVRPGFEPYLVRLAHHCRIAAGCELAAPWTPERVA